MDSIKIELNEYDIDCIVTALINDSTSRIWDYNKNKTEFNDMDLSQIDGNIKALLKFVSLEKIMSFPIIKKYIEERVE